jgi:hypothetical protein
MTNEAKNLIKTFGIENLSSQEQEEILAKVDERLEDVLLRVILESVSDEEAKELRLILEKGENIEEKVAEITSRVPMLAQKMEAAVAEEIGRLKKVIQV